jgi:hypothetical protein
LGPGNLVVQRGRLWAIGVDQQWPYAGYANLATGGVPTAIEVYAVLLRLHDDSGGCTRRILEASAGNPTLCSRPMVTAVIVWSIQPAQPGGIRSAVQGERLVDEHLTSQVL